MNDAPADPRSFVLAERRVDRRRVEDGDAEFWSWLLGVAILALGIASAAWFLITMPPDMLLDAATAEIVSHGFESPAYLVPLIDGFVEH
jgi:hypothetical protein